jgi:hypothetical protein
MEETGEGEHESAKLRKSEEVGKETKREMGG